MKRQQTLVRLIDLLCAENPKLSQSNENTINQYVASLLKTFLLEGFAAVVRTTDKQGINNEGKLKTYGRQGIDTQNLTMFIRSRPDAAVGNRDLCAVFNN